MMNLDREQMLDLFWCGVGAVVIILAALFFAVVRAPAAQAETPTSCPPKIYTCKQVRNAVSRYGADALTEGAKACRWTDADIARAMKCVKH